MRKYFYIILLFLLILSLQQTFVRSENSSDKIITVKIIKSFKKKLKNTPEFIARRVEKREGCEIG